MKSTLFFLGGLALASGCASEVDPVPIDESADSFVSGAVILPRTSHPFGRSISQWSESWWKWIFAVPAHQNPELSLEADCGVDQNDRVFFVPAYDGATSYERTCSIPFGKPVLVPLWVIVNDYPCPDPDFHPAPGQTLFDFLRDGAIAYNNLVTGLAVTWNGRTIDPSAHRHTTGLFEFAADPSLVGVLPDACLQGRPQPGVSDGYWLMALPGLGQHTVRIVGTAPGGDAMAVTYRLQVKPSW